MTELWVAGSLATGDYVPGVSDLDLVALVDGPVDPSREAVLVDLHRELDLGEAAGTDLGCVYVDAVRLPDPDARHPTWTHGQLVQRILSGVTRAELGRHGFAVLGARPATCCRRSPTTTYAQLRGLRCAATGRGPRAGHGCGGARSSPTWG